MSRWAPLAFGACLFAAFPAQAQQAPAPAPVPAATPKVAVFDVHLGPDIDQRVGPLAMAQLRRTAAALGFTLIDENASRAAATRAGAQGGLTPEHATELVRSTGATHGVFASVTASGGRYLATVQVTNADGTAPRSQNSPAAAAELDGVLDRLLRASLGLPASPVAAPPPPAAAPAQPTQAPPEPFPEGRWRAAVFTEGAVGVSGGRFYNHLAGVRADRRFSRDVAFGLAVAYANLKGKEGRANNWLPWAMLEYRIDLGSDWAIPLRYATGYLPKNGPVVRTSAGLAVAVSDSLDLSADLLAPTVWITNERAVVSLDFAAELAWTW